MLCPLFAICSRIFLMILKLNIFQCCRFFFSQKSTPSGLCNWNSSSLQLVCTFLANKKKLLVWKTPFADDVRKVWSLLPQLFVDDDEQMTKSNFICHKKQLVFLCSGMPSNNIIIIQNWGKNMEIRNNVEAVAYEFYSFTVYFNGKTNNNINIVIFCLP